MRENKIFAWHNRTEKNRMMLHCRKEKYSRREEKQFPASFSLSQILYESQLSFLLDTRKHFCMKMKKQDDTQITIDSRLSFCSIEFFFYLIFISTFIGRKFFGKQYVWVWISSWFSDRFIWQIENLWKLITKIEND